jgi:hypothetical protein
MKPLSLKTENCKGNSVIVMIPDGDDDDDDDNCTK